MSGTEQEWRQAAFMAWLRKNGRKSSRETNLRRFLADKDRKREQMIDQATREGMLANWARARLREVKA